MRLLILVCLIRCIGFCEIVRGAEKDLSASIEEVISDPRFATAHWGILVSDLESGTILYEQNADQLFAPASVTKLYSVAAALDAFGADHRFETPIYQRGTVTEEGVLEGDLILVASGDLTLGGRTDAEGRIAFTNSDHTYANGGTSGELTRPDPLAGLDELARQVVASGIKQVNGEVLIDDRLFDRAQGTGSGPSRVTPILVNDNLIDVTITPSVVGAPARVDWRPRTESIRLDAQVMTAGKEEPVSIRLHALTGDRWIVRGQIPQGHQPLVRVFEVEDPAWFARALLIDALRRAGVTLNASGLDANRGELLPASDDYTKLRRVAQLKSPPFAEEIKLILKVSHNLHASTLPLLLAAKHGARTLRDGLRLQAYFLERIGIDTGTISFGGGAGGSRADYTTPRATVHLLRAMARRPDFGAYENALPVLGIDGTLATAVVPSSPARGKVRAKTGTLFWENTMSGGYLLTSKALAGYMTSEAGRRLGFAFFVNNVTLRPGNGPGEMGRTLGRLCEVVYQNSGRADQEKIEP